MPLMSDRYDGNRKMISNILPANVVAIEVVGDAVDASLMPDEAEALGRVSDGRRREFTIARSCARRALAELGIRATPILIGADRQPLWPRNIVGSITHSSGYCAAAVAEKGRLAAIGIDAEIHEDLPKGVLDMVALDEELIQLRDLSGSDVCWDRLLFSAKESVYKAWYQITSKWLGFKDALVSIQPERGTFHARLLVDYPTVNDSVVSGFDGRYLSDSGFLLTAVVVNVLSDQ
jgi:4'-phosphopantetheinyl transferase EntD